MDNFQLLGGSYSVAEVLTLARSIGWGAAEILQSYYHGNSTQGNQSRDLNIQHQGDGPVTAADIAVNHYILDNLHAALGTQDFGYLSEETYKAQSTFSYADQAWVWIIDPLDGTRDFIDRTGEFAVHIALAYQGRPVLAVVACPETAKLYYATLGQGAFVEMPDGTGSYHSQPLQVSTRNRPEDLSLVASRTHRDERFNQLIQRLSFQQQHYVGSVGCKIAAIVEQQADVYISLSGKSAPKDWDMAAPELILTEAGGQFTHFDGTPLSYGGKDVNQWGGLMASNGHCHTALCTQATMILSDIDG